MEENKFWIALWKTIVIGFCTLAALIGGCNGMLNYQDNSAITEMVTKGANPLEARCSIKGTETHTCGILAATKNKGG